MIIPSRPSSPELDIQPWHRHSRYYLPHGNVVFRVADVLFRIRDEPLRSNSKAFAGHYLPVRIPPGTCVGTDDAPVVIEGVEPYEFDRLLGVIYPPFHLGGSSFHADYGLSEWLIVVDLAAFWNFTAVYNMALDHINAMHPNHVTIAALSEHHPLPQSWRLEAIKHLVARKEPLSTAEARELGAELTVWIFTTREILGEEWRFQEDLMEYAIHEIFNITT